MVVPREWDPEGKAGVSQPSAAAAAEAAIRAAGSENSIVFYDLETTVAFREGEECELLEFAAVVVTADGFRELASFCTLIRPSSMDRISKRSIGCNGITRELVSDAPSFPDVSDVIYSLLHERIWAGHNILSFDNKRLRNAFVRIDRSPPEPKAVIDTLSLLRKTFGTRAGNLKLATLGDYCGLGVQSHRSLDDVRMNIQTLKHCSTVLLLEKHFPEVYTSAHSNSKSKKEVKRASLGNFPTTSPNRASNQSRVPTSSAERNSKPIRANAKPRKLFQAEFNNDPISPSRLNSPSDSKVTIDAKNVVSLASGLIDHMELVDLGKANLKISLAKDVSNSALFDTSVVELVTEDSDQTNVRERSSSTISLKEEFDRNQLEAMVCNSVSEEAKLDESQNKHEFHDDLRKSELSGGNTDKGSLHNAPNVLNTARDSQIPIPVYDGTISASPMFSPPADCYLDTKNTFDECFNDHSHYPISFLSPYDDKTDAHADDYDNNGSSDCIKSHNVERNSNHGNTSNSNHVECDQKMICKKMSIPFAKEEGANAKETMDVKKRTDESNIFSGLTSLMGGLTLEQERNEGKHPRDAEDSEKLEIAQIENKKLKGNTEMKRISNASAPSFDSAFDVKRIDKNKIKGGFADVHLGRKNTVIFSYDSTPLCLFEEKALILCSVSDNYAFTNDGRLNFNFLIQPSAFTVSTLQACEQTLRDLNHDSLDEVGSPFTYLRNSFDQPLIRMKIDLIGSQTDATCKTQFWKKDGLDGSFKLHIIESIKPTTFRKILPSRSLIDVSFWVQSYVFQNRRGFRFLAREVFTHPSPSR